MGQVPQAVPGTAEVRQLGCRWQAAARGNGLQVMLGYLQCDDVCAGSNEEAQQGGCLLFAQLPEVPAGSMPFDNSLGTPQLFHNGIVCALVQCQRYLLP